MKVGDLENTESTEEVIKQVGRIDFIGPEITDEDGLFTVCPKAFDYRKNNMLKKDNFQDEVKFVQFQAMVAGQKAEFYAVRASELSAKAQRLEKFGSTAARNAANKLAKAQEQMVKLRQQLKDMGTSDEDIDNMLNNM